MTEEEKEAIAQLKSWREFIINNKEKVNKANDIEFYLRTALNLIQKQQEELKKKENSRVFYKQMYEKNCKDFEAYKNDKDINYLDEIHHKKLVEKSIGQIINKPEECWFDVLEVKIIKDDKIYSIVTEEDFVSLKEISDKVPEECITVIAESPLSGAIYRYNNNKKKEWQLIGTMLGYA